jgi:hypothetical protein
MNILDSKINSTGEIESRSRPSGKARKTDKPCRTYNATGIEITPVVSARLLYDRKSAAAMLSISVRSLDYLIVNRNIASRKIGSRVLIHHDDLTRFAQGANLRSVA